MTAPDHARDPRVSVVVLDPDTGRRAALGRVLADAGAVVVAAGSGVAARAAVRRTSARLLVMGPGVDRREAAAVAARLAGDGRACCVVRVDDGDAEDLPGVHHTVPVAESHAALTAWARALVSIVVPVTHGADRLTGALATGPDGLILLEDRPGEPDGGPDPRVAGLNEGAERFLGLRASDALGRRIGDLPAPAREILADACARQAAEGRPVEGEFPRGERWYAWRAVPAAGGVTVSLRDVTDRRRDDVRRECLWTLSEAIAQGSGIEALHQEVANVLARALGAALAAVGRAEDEDVRVLAVSRGAHLSLPGPPAPAASALAAAARTGRPVRVRFGEGTEGWHGPAAVEEVGVPVVLDGRVWGALLVAAGAVDEEAETFLGEVAALLAGALRREARRSELEAQAVTDPLTGLANRRAFEERLGREFARARRHGRSLALAIVDLDHFKAVNDRFGHAEGDAVLREVAARLVSEARGTDLVARIGGEEFAWLMPETEDLLAWQAVDRARRRVADTPFGVAGRQTVSAGVCDAGRADDARQLYLRADDALYWAKGNGRDVVFLYAEDTATALSRAEQGARPVTRDELRALRPAPTPRPAADPRPATRVATLAALLARAHGWDEVEADALREVVDRLGPDPVPLPVSPAPDPGGWSRHLTERWDGGGPGRLAGLAIPEAARIVRAAREWERLTAAPPHGRGLSIGEARVRLVGQRARVLCPQTVDHLLRLERGGALG